MSGDLVPHFPNHIRQTARALSLAGYSSQSIEAQLRQLYPQDVIPDDRTIRRWRAGQPELSVEEQEAAASAYREITLTAQRLTLERLTNKPDELNAVQLMTVAGIASSKEHERLQRSQPAQDNRQLVIVVNNPMSNEPVTIDATLNPPTQLDT